MRFLILSIVFTVFSGFIYAQNEITGTVKDKAGVPLPGVNVFIEGTTTGTITDLEGAYKIKAKSGDVLVFKYMGYNTQTVKVGDQTTIDVTLREEALDLDEVVVVGYGTMKKSDITGSSVSVKVEDDVARQYQTVDQMINGRAAGVQVIGNEGNMGSGISVKIRGTNTLRSNNEPLYVVDGVIITTAGEDASSTVSANDYSENQNGLNGINPRDIESIEVLKDASATAIYGSRGANGVILITTKQGKKGKPKIDAYYSASVSEISKKLDVLNGVEYAQYQNENDILNDRMPSYYIDGNDVYGMIGDSIFAEPYEQINWQDWAYKMAVSHDAGISFSGGSDKGTYYVSGSFNDQKGLVENTHMQGGNVRINLSRKLSDKLKFDANASLFYSTGQFVQNGSKLGAGGSFVKSTVTFNPLVGADVEEFYTELGESNPYAWIEDYQETADELKSILSMALTYDLPVKGLKLQVRAAGNNRFKERRKFYGVNTQLGSKNNGELNIASQQKWAWNINNLIMYNRTFNKVHRINATAGYIFDGNYMEDKTYTVADFSTSVFGVDGPEYGQIITSPLKTSPRTELMNSFLARVNYGFDNRYILTATIRADGSSKFAEGKRYGYFPSFSFAWRASEESFIKKLNVFYDLKLRLGWGQTGNQAIRPYQTMTTYNTAYYSDFNNGLGIAFVPANIANPDLTWETTTQANVGLDLGFFDGKLIASVDGYYKETVDLLQQIALPTSTGYKTMYTNRGSISNQGIDVLLNGVAIDKGDFYLSVGLNFSLNRNEILDLGIPDAPVWINGKEEMRSFYLGDQVSNGTYLHYPANIFMAGEPIGMFWGYQTNGIYQTADSATAAIYGAQPGDLWIVDQNNDSIIDGNDRTFLGDPNPDFSYGITLNFSWRNLSLSMAWNGVYGNEIANGFGLSFYEATGDAKNIHPAAYHNAWRENQPSNTYPRIGFKEEGWGAMTDRIIEDGSYIRMTNVTLGYNFEVKGFNRLFLYVSGKNLLTFTKYSGYDPNITSFLWNGNIQGVDWNPFPNTRTYIVGLNINF